MSVAFVRQNATGTASPYTITAAANGNLLVLYFAGFRSAAARTISSISSTNTTWTAKFAGTTNGGIDCEMWLGAVAGGSSGTSVTITMSGSGATLAMTALEFSGVTTTNDGTPVTNTGSSTAPATAAYSTTISDDLILTAAGYANGTAPTGSPGGAWQNITFANNSTTVGVAGAYQIKSEVVGAQSATWTITSAVWASVLGAVKASLPAATWLPSFDDRIFDKVSVVPY